MGGGPIAAIPTLLSIGSKLFGVTGAQAAGVPGGGSSAVSPFTAALMGGQSAGGAPVPPGGMLDPNVMNVKRLAIMTPHRRPILTPHFGEAFAR
jgi:hypothetical protein